MISIIVSMDEKRGIGKRNALMWHIPGELPRFKSITMGHPVIMGRKTFESIGRPLPNRTNIVLSRSGSVQEPGILRSKDTPLLFVLDLDQAIDLAKTAAGSDEIFIIGGGQIYQQAMEKGIVDRLYLTLVEGDFGADTFFSDYSNFTKVISEEDREDAEYNYKFLILEK